MKILDNIVAVLGITCAAEAEKAEQNKKDTGHYNLEQLVLVMSLGYITGILARYVSNEYPQSKCAVIKRSIKNVGKF